MPHLFRVPREVSHCLSAYGARYLDAVLRGEVTEEYVVYQFFDGLCVDLSCGALLPAPYPANGCGSPSGWSPVLR